MYLSAESKNKFVLSEDKFMKFKKGLVKNVLFASACVEECLQDVLAAIKRRKMSLL